MHGTKRRKDNQLPTSNSPVEYSYKEWKHDIKESEGNMFNPIFMKNVQGRRHPGSCASAESELFSQRKPRSVVQKIKNDHKNPNYNNSHNYLDENHDEIKLYQGNSHMSI